MHTVTKVLVVFASVLCVLLAALTMAYSVNVDRVTGDYQAERDRRLQAETSATDLVGQAQAKLQEKEQELAALNANFTNLKTQIATLEAERAQLVTGVRAAEAARDAIVAQVAQVQASNNTLVEINKSYAGEVTSLRDSELARSRREIELVDRINDLESQLEVRTASVRALQEQLAEANRALQSAGPGRTTTQSPDSPYRPSIAINGRVLNVGKDPATGKPMATINVGANDQVRENMELVITRNGNFVANLVVTKTDLQWSMGRIDALGKQVTIQPGDTVTTLASR